MTVQGILLDVDGTLVASNDAHAQAWVQTFAKYGYEEITYDQVRPMMGMGSDQILPQLIPGLSKEDETGKAITHDRRQLFLQEFVSHLKATPGARDLVLKLQGAGYKIMVASSASPEELETLLKIAQVDDLLQESTSSGDAEKSKPEPDIVEAALNKIGMSPEQVVMIGDTPYDIEAAGKAGVGVVAFRSGGFKDEDLAESIALYDDPADLLHQFDRSVFAPTSLAS